MIRSFLRKEPSLFAPTFVTSLLVSLDFNRNHAILFRVKHRFDGF